MPLHSNYSGELGIQRPRRRRGLLSMHRIGFVSPLFLKKDWAEGRGLDFHFRQFDNQSMKITVEVSDSELAEICAFTRESKKGPAIRKMVIDALMLKRRQAMAEKFISGEWGVELAGIDDDRPHDRKQSADRDARWRS